VPGQTLTALVRVLGIVLLLLTVSIAGVVCAGLWGAKANPRKSEFLGFRVLVMGGDEMSPSIKPQALVFVRVNDLAIAESDVIAYTPETLGSPVLSRVAAKVDENFTVCQDNVPQTEQQLVFPQQVIGRVPGSITLVRSFIRGIDWMPEGIREYLLKKNTPLGVWNWAAPIVRDLRAENGTLVFGGLVKWSVLVLGTAVLFGFVWFALERRLRQKRAEAEEREADALEEIYSTSPAEPLPTWQMPLVAQAPDGQPLAVFPAFPDAPLVAEVGAPLPIPTPEEPAHALSDSPVVSDAEFADMLKQFELDFL
jgi:hypothetical protein